MLFNHTFLWSYKQEYLALVSIPIFIYQKLDSLCKRSIVTAWKFAGNSWFNYSINVSILLGIEYSTSSEIGGFSSSVWEFVWKDACSLEIEFVVKVCCKSESKISTFEIGYQQQ